MPSPELVAKALALIERRPVNHAYFFRKLDSPDWIKPLVEAGLFSTPPSPQLVEEDLISFPPWPESDYLARMAPFAPKEVGAVLLEIPATRNESVHMDLARAAAHVPVKMAARWATKEAAWLSDQDRVHMPIAEALGPVMGRLAESGQVGAAMALAKSLLELRTVTETDGRRLVREPSAAYTSVAAASGELVAVNPPTRIVPRVDGHEYEEFVRLWVPVLLRHGGTHALAMLCDILEPPRDTDELHDFTDTVSRPAIEAHHQNYGHDPTDFLIDAVRDGSKQLVAAGIDIRQIAQILSDRRCAIFQRILLHLAKEQCGEHPRFAAELAVCEDRFFDDRLFHEYSGLLGAVFPNLSLSERATVLSWIEAGPSLDDRFDGSARAGPRSLLRSPAGGRDRQVPLRRRPARSGGPRQALRGGARGHPGCRRGPAVHVAPRARKQRGPVICDGGSGSLPPAPGPARRVQRRERNRFPSSTGSDRSGTALSELEPGELRATVLSG